MRKEIFYMPNYGGESRSIEGRYPCGYSSIAIFRDILLIKMSKKASKYGINRAKGIVSRN